MKVLPGDEMVRLVAELSSAGDRPSCGPAGRATDAFYDLLRKQLEGTFALTASSERQGLEAFVELARIGLNRSVMAAFAGWDDGDAPSLLDSIPSMGMPTPMSKIERTHPDPSEGEGSLAISEIIDRASATYGVDRDLIAAVIKAESGFDPGATSPKGAMGLMQLMPETARALGVTDPYDPVQNVMAGTRFLRSLIDRYGGDVERALAAYNWGAGNLERGATMPRETREYIARVLGDYFGTKA